MKIIQIYKADLLNGVGLRNVYFFSGCTHHCYKCFNPETSNPDMPLARPWTDEDFEQMIKDASKNYIDGITLSGGDPLSQYNVYEICNLCKKFKERLPNKTIWCYTGYKLEDILSLIDGHPRKEVLKYIDVLCDGRYEDWNKSPDKPWVGSSNQRVINIPKTIQSQQIVLYC